MLIGILLGIALSIMIVSGFFFVYGLFIGIEKTAFTAAVVGSREIISYSLVSFILSLIAVAFLIILLRRKKSY